MTGNVLITGGRLLDPARQEDGLSDLRIVDGHVAEHGKLTAQPGETVIDATGLLVTPGLVDLCVHLREPGFEEIETIRSGAEAALAGGFTSIAAMPDTDPPVDNEASVTYIRLKGEQARAARVYAVGTLTRGRQGTHLSEMGGMARAGAVAFSDEDNGVDGSDIFLRSLRYAGMLERPILSRSEDRALRGNGVAVSGLVADLLGLPAVAAGTEEVMLERNLRLARSVGADLHLLHLSSGESIEVVRAAKVSGHTISCSVTPPHLLLSEECLRTYDPVFKFRPPLRPDDDRVALVAALRDGTVDAITAGHVPRGEGEKNLEFIYAADGTGGLETAFSVLHTRLVCEGDLPLGRLIDALSAAPARILGIPGGRLAVGDPADVTCFDLQHETRVDPATFRSHTRLSPFTGWQVRGQVRHVLVGGEIRIQDGRRVE